MCPLFYLAVLTHASTVVAWAHFLLARQVFSYESTLVDYDLGQRTSKPVGSLRVVATSGLPMTNARSQRGSNPCLL